MRGAKVYFLVCVCVCVLKCLNKRNGRKNTADSVFVCYKGQVDSVYFRCIDITTTKQYTCETADKLITRMELFLYCIDNANIMTQQLLSSTFMQPNSVIYQPNYYIDSKNGDHLHFRNVYL